MNPGHPRERAFTLIELAIVLIIVSLLAGEMLLSLGASRDAAAEKETHKQLASISEALLGFAAINGRLPCPSTETDPAGANYGSEDPACPDSEGYLPWKSLGVPETDAWGTRRNTVSAPFSGYWRYRVHKEFTTSFKIDSKPGDNYLVVLDATGTALTETGEKCPLAIVYSTGPDLAANGQNAPNPGSDPNNLIYQAGERNSGFDDALIWINRPILFNRMISAGQLSVSN